MASKRNSLLLYKHHAFFTSTLLSALQALGQIFESLQFDDFTVVPWFPAVLLIANAFSRVLDAVALAPITEAMYVGAPIDADQAIVRFVEVQLHRR